MLLVISLTHNLTKFRFPGTMMLSKVVIPDLVKTGFWLWFSYTIKKGYMVIFYPAKYKR